MGVLPSLVGDPYRATFLSRAVPEGAQTDLLVERVRSVDQGMREDLTLRNLSAAQVTMSVSLSLAADFADVFEVKESQVRRRGELSTQTESKTVSGCGAWPSIRSFHSDRIRVSQKNSPCGESGSMSPKRSEIARRTLDQRDRGRNVAGRFPVECRHRHPVAPPLT